MNDGLTTHIFVFPSSSYIEMLHGKIELTLGSISKISLAICGWQISKIRHLLPSSTSLALSFSCTL